MMCLKEKELIGIFEMKFFLFFTVIRVTVNIRMLNNYLSCH